MLIIISLLEKTKVGKITEIYDVISGLNNSVCFFTEW